MSNNYLVYVKGPGFWYGRCITDTVPGWTYDNLPQNHGVISIREITLPLRLELFRIVVSLAALGDPEVAWRVVNSEELYQ